ncbi:MAG: polysaccharide biosynthesis/export family protein [Planctomycetaceae bacterium]
MSVSQINRFPRLNPLAIAATLTVSSFLSGCCSSTAIPVGGSCGPVQCGSDGCGSAGCGTEGCGVGGSCGAEGCGSGACGIGGGFGCCEVPRELRKTALPEYRIEPPDVLLIEAANHLRPVSAPILSGEPLLIQVNRTLPAQTTEAAVSRQFKTINGMYVIGTDGYVNLGPEYGKVLCANQPLSEIQDRVEKHLQRILTKPQVLVTLPNPTAKQFVAGPHLVRPDGTVGLGFTEVCSWPA